MTRIRSIWGFVVAAALAVLPFPAIAQTPQPSPPPAEAYAKLPFVESAVLSPSGLRVAGIFAVKGERLFRMFNLGDPNEQVTEFRIPEKSNVSWIRWVNEENVAIGIVAQQRIEVDYWYISRIVGVNRITGKVSYPLWDMNGQNAADVVWMPSDGTKELLVAAQKSIFIGDAYWPTVYAVDIETGAKRRVVTGRLGVMDWYADSSGTVRTGVLYNDRRSSFQLLHRNEGSKASFATVNTASFKEGETLIVPEMYIPGSEHAIVLASNEQGKASVFEIDLPTGKLVRTVYDGKEGSEVEDVIVSRDGTALLGVVTSEKTGSVHWIDPDLAAMQVAFGRAAGNRKVSILSLSADRKRMLLRLAPPNGPGQIYFYDDRAGRMQLLAAMNPEISDQTLAPVSLVQYSARDGLQIEAVLTLPPGRDAKNLPAIIMPHGGPWAQDTLGYDYWAQFLASRGYAVLQPNFRGSTGYGSDFEKAGEGQLGLAMQDDVSDGFAWLVKQGIADPGRVCIVGASYGGYAAMWGIAREPDLYRCAISISGVSSLSRTVKAFGGSYFGKKYRSDWEKMTPDFAAVSPINAVERITAPLLLIHGKKDSTVEIVESDAMYDRMRQAGKQVEFVKLPLADHYFGREADRLVLLQQMEAFLTRNNPPDPAPH